MLVLTPLSPFLCFLKSGNPPQWMCYPHPGSIFLFCLASPETPSQTCPEVCLLDNSKSSPGDNGGDPSHPPAWSDDFLLFSFIYYNKNRKKIALQPGWKPTCGYQPTIQRMLTLMKLEPRLQVFTLPEFLRTKRKDSTWETQDRSSGREMVR